MVVPHTTGQLVRSMVRVPGSGLDREAMPSCLDLSNVSSLAATVIVPKTLPKALVRPFQTTSTEGNLESKTSKLVGDNKLENKDVVQERSDASNSTVGQKRPLSSMEAESEMTSSSNPQASKAPRIALLQPQQVQSVSACIGATQPTPIFVLAGSSFVLQTQPQQTLQFPTVVVQQNQLPDNVSVKVNGMTPHPVQIQQLPCRIISRPTQKSQAPLQNPQGPSTDNPTLVKMSISQLLEERQRLQAENKVLNETLTRYQNLFKNKESLKKIANYISVRQ